jgi:hypothetical protein
VINISNYTSKDNTPGLPDQPVRTAAATGAPARTATHRRSPGARAENVLVLTGRVLLSWLAAIPRRLGDRLFTMNDTEAYWRGWQITKTHGGLARSYRDPRFDTLAECARCRGTGSNGAGVNTDVPCAPCLGTGRITRGEVS